MEDEKKTSFSICVLTYNRAALLKELLKSLSRLKYEPLELIVVDNSSSDNTESMVRNEFTNVLYIRTNSNLGAAARNFSLKMASGDIVITLDDDILNIWDEDLINLAERFEKEAGLGAINFKVLDHATGVICNWVHHCDPAKFSEQEFPTYEITEGAVAFRRSALKKSGYYPEKFFLSHEGPDLALRLIKSGYSLIYSPVVSVFHTHSELGRKSWLNYYFDTRNQIWLAARNLPLAFSVPYLIRGIGAMFIYSLRDGFAIYWFKGVVDGVLGLKRALRERDKLDRRSMALVKRIDAIRPSLSYYFNERLRKKGVRL